MNVFGEADDWVESVPEPLTVIVWNAMSVAPRSSVTLRLTRCAPASNVRFAVAPCASSNTPSPLRSQSCAAIEPSLSLALDVKVTVSPALSVPGA